MDLSVIKFGIIVNTVSHEYEKHDKSDFKVNLMDGVIFKRE